MSLLGDRLKSARKKIGMSQVELAKKTGLSKSTICNYENGKREKVSTPVIMALCDALGVSPYYLQGWKEDMHKVAEADGSIGARDIIVDGEYFDTSYIDPEDLPMLQYADKLRENEKRQEESEKKSIQTGNGGKMVVPGRLIKALEKLNMDGKQEAAKRVEELTFVPQYTEKVEEDGQG